MAPPLYSILLWAGLVNAIAMGQSWSDEFDGGRGQSPAFDKWIYDLGDGADKGIVGWGNGELQYYTNSTDNCALDGQGHLVITASKVSNAKINCYYGPCSFTSCRLLSIYTQKYGRFEARMKLPSGKGIWPAFWMLGQDIDTVGWPKCGEIDIMEFRGSATDKVSGTVHGPGYNGANGITASYTTSSTHFHEDFHVFAVNWQPDKIEWTVNGEVYASVEPRNLLARSEWVFNKPFKMLINLAIGGHYDGYPMDNETFPKQLLVDYVRVYAYDGNDSSEGQLRCQNEYKVMLFLSAIVVLYYF